MAGLSGGGWTTTFAAAIDKRITGSFPIAGSVPCSMRNPLGHVVGQNWTGNDDEDFEQSCNTPNASYPIPPVLPVGSGPDGSPGRAAFLACNYTCQVCCTHTYFSCYSLAVALSLSLSRSSHSFSCSCLPNNSHLRVPSRILHLFLPFPSSTSSLDLSPRATKCSSSTSTTRAASLRTTATRRCSRMSTTSAPSSAARAMGAAKRLRTAGSQQSR